MRDLGLLYRIRQKTEAITWQSRRGHVSQSENEKFVPTRLCFLDINHGLHVVSDLCDLRDKTKSWNVPVMSGHSITVLLTQPSGNIQTQQQHNSSDWRNRMWRTVFAPQRQMPRPLNWDIGFGLITSLIKFFGSVPLIGTVILTPGDRAAPWRTILISTNLLSLSLVRHHQWKTKCLEISDCKINTR